MEVAGGRDDLRLPVLHALDAVGPEAGGLDAGLDGLGAGVHRQHEILPAQFREGGGEGAELVVVEGAAGEGEPAELIGGGLDEFGMEVAEVEGRVGREEVQVGASLDVGDPDVPRGGDHHGQGVIVVGDVRVVVVFWWVVFTSGSLQCRGGRLLRFPPMPTADAVLGPGGTSTRGSARKRRHEHA